MSASPQDELVTLDAAAMARAVRTSRASASALVQASLARIDATDGRVNAFTDIVRERALARAAAIDNELATATDGALRNKALLGVPFAVKNLFDIGGLRTLAGSKIERDSAPATADGVLVKRMEDAGAVLVGALNMDEYAYGFTTENSHEGAAHNPHDLTPHCRWLVGWLRRRSGGGPGADHLGLGHQWLDPRALVAVRRVWPEAHLRAAAAYRQLPLHFEPRSSGPVRAIGRRPGLVV